MAHLGNQHNCGETGSNKARGLPQEIIDHVIELVDNVDTLHLCCLVSTSFYATSIRALFRDIVVTPPRLNHLQDMLLDSPLKAAAVRSFNLHGFNTSQPQPGIQPPVTSLQSLIPCLASLEHFSASGTLWDMVLKHPPGLAPLSMTVTSISLRATQFSHLSDLLGFLSAFPNLRGLTMSYVSWAVADVSVITANPSLSTVGSRLRNLNVSFTPQDAVQCIFPENDGDTEDNVRLHTLAVEWLPSIVDDHHSWWNLVSRAKLHLENLVIYKCHGLWASSTL